MEGTEVWDVEDWGEEMSLLGDFKQDCCPWADVPTSAMTMPLDFGMARRDGSIEELLKWSLEEPMDLSSTTQPTSSPVMETGNRVRAEPVFGDSGLCTSEQETAVDATPTRKPRSRSKNKGASSDSALSLASSVTRSTSPGAATRKRFQCSRCDSTFTARFNLNKHVRIVHENRRPFHCETCGACFQQKCHLKQHKNSVHINKIQHRTHSCAALPP